MISGNAAPIVVRPRSPLFTTIGTWLVRLCLPWLLLSLLALDAALTAMGMPSGDTLAESVVQVRPDRFALAPDKPSLGRPASFDLRDRVGAGVDLVAWKRRRDTVLIVVLAALILLGAIGVVLLTR